MDSFDPNRPFAWNPSIEGLVRMTALTLNADQEAEVREGLRLTLGAFLRDAPDEGVTGQLIEAVLFTAAGYNKTPKGKRHGKLQVLWSEAVKNYVPKGVQAGLFNRPPPLPPQQVTGSGCQVPLHATEAA